jgi:hypothetical protein
MPKISKEKNFYALAAENGYDAWAMWSSPAFADLKKKRKDPAYLTPDDEFQWPARNPAQPSPTGGKLTAFLRPQPKVIDVYLGFMDEEVNARLMELIKRECDKPNAKDRRPVLLVERGKLSPGDFILEWPLDNYPEPARSLTITQVSSKGDLARMANVDGLSDSGESPDAILARMLALAMEQDVPDEIKRGLKKNENVVRYVDLLGLLQKRRAVWKNGAQVVPSKVALPTTSEAPPAWLSVVRFNVGDDRNAPIVVIRTPEMGLQPSLMSPYISFLFKAISALADQLAVSQADRWRKIANPAGETREQTLKRTLGWPIRVCQFGAQGSTSALAQYQPGEVLPVVASLFVGFEVDSMIEMRAGGKITGVQQVNDGDDPKYRIVTQREGETMAQQKWEASQRGCQVWASVSLCTPTRVYHLLRQEVTEGPLATRIENAELAAREFLYKAKETPPAIDPTRFIEATGHPLLEVEKEETKGAKNLKELVAALGTASLKLLDSRTPAAVTLTSSFFGGQKDKDACNALGIVSVGMEDYHVLRVLQAAGAKGADKNSDYPLLLGWRIDRINCDPLQIPEEVEHAFQEFIQKTPITRGNYVDVIAWGLMGTLGPGTPACAQWGFPDALKEKAKGLFYRYTPPEGRESFVPNPLFVEIATDLVKELKDDPAKALTGSKLPEAAKGALKAKAAEVFAEWRSSTRDVAKGRALIGELLDLLIAHAGFGSSAKHLLLLELEGDKSDAVEVEVDGAQPPVRVDAGAKVVEGTSCKVKLKDGQFVSGPGVVELKGAKTYKVRVSYAPDAPMKTWLRPGKWDSASNKIAKSAAVEDLKANGEHFDGAAIDRAFYKSCNLMALQSLASTRLL